MAFAIHNQFGLIRRCLVISLLEKHGSYSTLVFGTAPSSTTIYHQSSRVCHVCASAATLHVVGSIHSVEPGFCQHAEIKTKVKCFKISEYIWTFC